MKPHPLTIAYLNGIREQPGMFYCDNDLAAVEHQLHGFDAALAACDTLSNHSRFNEQFLRFLVDKTGLSGSQGWSRALLRAHGQTELAVSEFYRLLCDFLNDQRSN